MKEKWETKSHILLRPKRFQKSKNKKTNNLHDKGNVPVAEMSSLFSAVGDPSKKKFEFLKTHFTYEPHHRSSSTRSNVENSRVIYYYKTRLVQHCISL